MKINRFFKSWNQPYLFQELEEIERSLTPAERSRIISLGIGDPDLPTPRAIREAIMREHRERYHGYPSVEGRQDLREAIAAYYWNRFNVSISPDDILVSIGAKTDLFDFPAVFANPGDTVAIMDPAYPVYRDSALFHGQNIISMPGTEDNNFQPDLDTGAVKGANLALIYLGYPNNPTGVVASQTYVARMINLAIREKALIIYDIAYADFRPGNLPSDAFSIFSLDGGETVGIEVGSFSKPFSMTGDRISWVAIKNPEVKSVWKRFRSNRDSGASNYDQAGALAALTDPSVGEAVKSNMAEYGRRANLVKTALETGGYRVYGLDNSPYAWFRIPTHDSRKAARFVLREAGLILTPGAGFGPAGESYMRATIFQPEDRLREAMDRLLQIDFSRIET